MTDWGSTQWNPDEDEPPEWESEAWDEGDDYGDSDDYESESIECPECGAAVYEDSPLCPVCGFAMSRARSPLAGRPNWYVIFGVIGILVTVFVLATGGFF